MRDFQSMLSDPRIRLYNFCDLYLVQYPQLTRGPKAPSFCLISGLVRHHTRGGPSCCRGFVRRRGFVHRTFAFVGSFTSLKLLSLFACTESCSGFGILDCCGNCDEDLSGWKSVAC